MAGETVTEERVTDEALAAAFAGEAEVKVEEPVSVEDALVIDDEPTAEEKAAEEAATNGMSAEEIEKHRERSRAGRKFKAGGLKAFEELQEEFNQFKASVQTKLGTPAPEALAAEDEADAEERDRINDLLLTDPMAGHEEMIKYKAAKESAETKKYQGGYIGKVIEIGKTESSEFAEEIYHEMTKDPDRNPFNVMHTGNPVVDAEINWHKAKASLLQRYVTEGKKPVYKGKGDKTEPPIGPSGTHAGVAARVEPRGKLSDDAEAFASYLNRKGWDDDKITKAAKR